MNSLFMSERSLSLFNLLSHLLTGIYLTSEILNCLLMLQRES